MVGLADVGFVPAAGVDVESLEDAALEGAGAGDHVDGAVAGGEGDSSDPVELLEGAGGGEGLVGKVGVLHAGVGEVSSDEHFDDGGENTDADMAADPVLGPVVDGSEVEEVFEHSEPVFDVGELPVVANDLSGGGLAGGEAGAGFP